VRNLIPATVVALVVWALLSATVIPAPAALADDEPPFGVGYWKNHPEAWPVTELTLDGVTYDRAGLLQILSTSASGDVTYELAHQLIAALLNVAIGVEVPADAAAAMDAAQAFLTAHPLGTAPTDPAARREAEWILKALIAFNEGKI